MKVFTLAPRENWVVDQFVKEWNEFYSKPVKITFISADQDIKPVNNPVISDLVWLCADWCWRQIDPHTLAKKKVIATVHHITTSKFNEAAKKDFELRDQFVDAYHVPCLLTKKQIEGLTNKPIYCFSFWVNQNMWYPKGSKKALRKEYREKGINIQDDDIVIFSAQRDTEGAGISKGIYQPKLEKGPDLFCDYVIELHKREPRIKVLLGGWRRQYIMERLKKANVPFVYKELPSFNVINDFYNLSDLYLVSSREEGGPRAVQEACATKTPVISTRVGVAPELLSERCMIDRGATLRSAEQAVEENYKNVSKLFMPQGFMSFEDMIKEV